MPVSPRTRLFLARRKREAAERWSTAAHLYMLEAVGNANAAGIPKTEIARIAGVSRQTVYDILGEKP